MLPKKEENKAYLFFLAGEVSVFCTYSLQVLENMLLSLFSESLCNAFLAPATSISANFCRCWKTPAANSLFLHPPLLPLNNASTTITGNFLSMSSHLGSNIFTNFIKPFSSLANSFLFHRTVNNDSNASAPASCRPTGLGDSISFTNEPMQLAIARLLPSLIDKLASKDAEICCEIMFPCFISSPRWTMRAVDDDRIWDTESDTERELIARKMCSIVHEVLDKSWIKYINLCNPFSCIIKVRKYSPEEASIATQSAAFSCAALVPETSKWNITGTTPSSAKAILISSSPATFRIAPTACVCVTCDPHWHASIKTETPRYAEIAHPLSGSSVIASIAMAAFSLTGIDPVSRTLNKCPNPPSSNIIFLDSPSDEARIETAETACSRMEGWLLKSSKPIKYPIFPSLATKLANFWSSFRTWRSDSNAGLLNSAPPTCNLVKRSWIKKTNSSLLEPGPGWDRIIALDWWSTPDLRSKPRSWRWLERDEEAISRSLWKRSLPPRKELVEEHWWERERRRWRVERREGRRVWRRGFWGQRGESEREEREDWREVSLGRRTCHRPMKDWTVIVDRRRRERTFVIRFRSVSGGCSCGGSEVAVVGCIWSGIGLRRCQILST